MRKGPSLAQMDHATNEGGKRAGFLIDMKIVAKGRRGQEDRKWRGISKKAADIHAQPV